MTYVKRRVDALCSPLHIIHPPWLPNPLSIFCQCAPVCPPLCLHISPSVCLCAAEGAMPQPDSRCALTHCSTQATAVLPCLRVEDTMFVCVCVCVCVWSVCVRQAGVPASLATDAAATLLKERREREDAGGVEGDRETEREREREGVQAQIKPWGPGLGQAPFCYKYTGRLEVRVWWLGFGTSDHHCCSSLPQGILLRILILLTLVISVLGIQDASRGRRPQAGLQGCPLQTQEEQPEESLRGRCH